MNALSETGAVPTLDSVRAVLIDFARSHPGITCLVVFGSVARGEAHAASDVDVVADFAPGSIPSGLEGFGYLYDLKCELALQFGRDVHLLTQGAVDNARRIGNRALPEAVERDGKLVYAPEPKAA